MERRTKMGWIILVLLVLAVIFLRFTIVKEGTAKVVVRLGAFKRAIISWEGYRLARNWEVEKSKELLRLPGGLRFVGIRLLDKVYSYGFRWRDIQLVEGEEKIEFHDEPRLDYILIRPDVYFTDIKDAETKPPERIPLSVQFLITLRVVNPKKALFNAPPNWNENVMTRLNALFRGWVAENSLDDLLLLKDDPVAIWNHFKDTPLIKMFKQEWGIKVENNGIEMRTIDLPEEYQKAAASQRKLEFEAAARSSETVGTVIQMMARVRGHKDTTVVEAEIEKDPEMQKEFLSLAKDLVVRKLGIEGRSYLDIRVQGAEGIERSLLNALATWKRMPLGEMRGEKEKKKKGRKVNWSKIKTGGDLMKAVEEEEEEEGEEM